MQSRKGIVAALLLGAIAFSGCGPGSSDTGSGGRPERLEPTTAQADRRDIVGFDVLNAKLITPPTSIAEVHPTYQAPLKRVLVTVGKRVSRGEVLMELDLPDQQAQHDTARVTVEAAEQSYNSARQTLRAPLKEAQLRLEQAQSTERAIRGRIDPTGDATELVDATNARKAAEAEVQQRQSEYQAAIQPYAQSLEDARAAERATRAGVKQGSVRAPISGTVIELNAQTGSQVGADQNEVLAKIVDLDDVKLRAEVPPTLTDRIKKGDEIVVTFREIPDQRFTGYVRGLRTIPDPAGKAKVEAEIELRNTQGLVKPEMTPNPVAIQTQRVRQVIAVPADAIDRDETGRPIVRVLVGSQWKVRVVEPGVSNGQWTQVVKGIKEGETVQVTP